MKRKELLRTIWFTVLIWVVAFVCLTLCKKLSEPTDLFGIAILASIQVIFYWLYLYFHSKLKKGVSKDAQKVVVKALIGATLFLFAVLLVKNDYNLMNVEKEVGLPAIIFYCIYPQITSQIANWQINKSK